ncbi:MAG: tRNA (adenosine(37)-N6)-dimethylallyltransferase MiaA [Desulfobacterales bacterium]|nr:tRNA (adenosine(37)-N6)-dimethylallyltransferase MiaA [Desulfobacterales bacterium]
MIPDPTKPKIVVICGPTGVGKTAVAVDLAPLFHGEIIGADSMQVYRHMDIGTAKPGARELKAVPHHMIDMVDPDGAVDAARYAQTARNKITDLHRRHVLPFVVGGTGLYIKALLHGLFAAREVAPEIRSRLKAEAALLGSKALHRRLCECDPQAAEKIHAHDAYRIIRALETFEATGKPLSGYHNEHRFAGNPYSVLKIGLTLDRKTLYERIEKRTERMMAAGFIDEVKNLMAMGYAPGLNSMQALGYRHISGYLAGRWSEEEMLRTLTRDTRRYAKRQLTWFKKDAAVIWKQPDQTEDIKHLVENFLRRGRPLCLPA